MLSNGEITPPWGTPRFPHAFRINLSQHLIICHSLGNLLQQNVMPHIVEVGAQIKVNDIGLAPQDRFRYASDRLMG